MANVDWINPKYRTAIENFVYIDPNDGNMKDMGACMACGGSGQSSM